MSNSVKYMLSNMPSFNSNTTWVIISAILKSHELMVGWFVLIELQAGCKHRRVQDSERRADEQPAGCKLKRFFTKKILFYEQ